MDDAEPTKWLWRPACAAVDRRPGGDAGPACVELGPAAKLVACHAFCWWLLRCVRRLGWQTKCVVECVVHSSAGRPEKQGAPEPVVGMSSACAVRDRRVFCYDLAAVGLVAAYCYAEMNELDAVVKGKFTAAALAVCILHLLATSLFLSPSALHSSLVASRVVARCQPVFLAVRSCRGCLNGSVKHHERRSSGTRHDL